MSLIGILTAVESAVGGASFAVIGAVARNAWAPPRATTDLDLTISARSGTLDAIDAKLREIGYSRVREQRVESTDPLPDIVIFRSEQGEPQQVPTGPTSTSTTGHCSRTTTHASASPLPRRKIFRFLVC